MRPYVLHWLESHMRGDLANVLAPSWFTCVGLAGIAALLVMLALGRRRGMNPATITSAVLWGYGAAVVAGILVPMVIQGVEDLAATGRFHLRWAGMTSFWGYLAGAAAVTIVCERDGVPVGRMGDLAVVPLGIALVFARLGCFMAGCDYGKVSSLPWAVRFPAGSPAWRDHVHAGLVPADRIQSLPVHPTQLYEAALGLVIIGVSIYAARRKREDGQLFVLAAATYALGRLVIETLRGDAGRGVYAGLSSGQIFSLVVLLAIAARFVVAHRRAITVVAAAAFVLAVGHAGEADAQPAPDPQSTPLVFPDLAERPEFSTGLLYGIATPLNRHAAQVPTLSGPSISLGYLPGRFGVWIDLDSYTSAEATHDTLLVSGSFTQRLTRRLVVGGRIGLGHTTVDFTSPVFQDAAGTTLRVELIAEYMLARHWAIWVRPFAIDTLIASDLGGPITTSQFRAGFTYRFGSRHNAVHAMPIAPPEPRPALPTLGAL